MSADGQEPANLQPAQATDIQATLDHVAELAHRHQLATSQLLGTKDDTDYLSWFAELHAQVSNAMQAYRALPDPSEIVWIDAETGSLATPEEGVPAGVPAHLAEAVLSIIGFMKHMGCNVGEIFAMMLNQQSLFEQAAMVGETDNDEEASEAKD